jgi:hypothetical protein
MQEQKFGSNFANSFMLNLPTYTYYTNASHFDYEFESEGPKGVIKKVARFGEMGKNIYNFGFGDLDEATGEISDTVKSNNGDADKVLGTVAHIIYDFTGLFQGAAIFIKGTNAARTRWYQMGISSHWEQIEPVFEIIGRRNGEWEPFRKGTNYEAFIGRRKASFLLANT